MPKEITSVELWQADRSAQVSTPGSSDLLYQLNKAPRVTHKLGQLSTCSLEVLAGSDAALSTSFFQKRRILRFVYDDGSIAEYRITQINQQLTGESPVSISGKHIAIDLHSRKVYRTLSTGGINTTISFSGITAQQALDRLLGSDYNAPSLFKSGSVDGSINGTVDLNANGRVSHLELIRQIAGHENVRGEVEHVYNSANDDYTVNIVTQVGASSGTRKITFGPDQTENNRRKLTKDNRTSSGSYFSRVIPLGGAQGEQITIAKALWPVASSSYDSNAGETTITLEDDPVYDTDSIAAIYWGTSSGGFFEVLSATSPDQIVVSGDASALTEGKFVLNSAGDDLIYLRDYTAEVTDNLGIVEQTVQRPDIPAFPNRAADAGIAADLSTYPNTTSDPPTGWQDVGSPTTTKETGDIYFEHGSAAWKVTADQGDGVETDLTNFPIALESDYACLWTHIRLGSGSVRVELVSSGGETNPDVNGQVVSDAQELRALKVEGMRPPADDYKVRVIAQENGTTFYLDAVTVTESATALPYQSNMGPRALWQAGAQLLEDKGGTQPAQLKGSAWDYVYEDGSHDELSIGDTVTFEDGWRTGGGHEVSGDYRLVRVVEREGEDGRRIKDFDAARAYDSFADRGNAEPQPAETAPTPKSIARMVVKDFIKSEGFTSGSAGFILRADGTAELNEITINGVNPAGSTVTIRQSSAPSARPSGESLQEGDTWIDTDDGDNPYTWNGSSWILARTHIDGGDIVTGTIAAQHVTVGSGSTFDSGYDPSDTRATIRQTSSPSSRPSGDPLEAGDIWIDTDNGDKPYTWDGNSWEQGYTQIDGGFITTGTVAAAHVEVGSSSSFDSGYDPSDGRAVIRQSTSPSSRPSGDPLQDGDIWVDTGDGDKPYSWNGSSWIAAYTIIDGGNITTGTIDADQVTIEADGTNVVIDSSGISIDNGVAAGWDISASSITSSSSNIELDASAETITVGGITIDGAAGEIQNAVLAGTGGSIPSGAEVAAVGTLSAGGGRVVLDSGGIQITAGTVQESRIDWTDGSSILSSNDVMLINADGRIEVEGGTGSVKLISNGNELTWDTNEALRFPTGGDARNADFYGFRSKGVNSGAVNNNLHVKDGELYFRDGSGNYVQLTSNGSPA